MFNNEMVPRSFAVGDLIFYAYDHRIFRDGENIGASGKDYQILCSLAQRVYTDDKHISREDVKLLLTGGKLRCEHLVEVYIYRARELLKSKKSNVTIETVRNKGYCMSVAPADTTSFLLPEKSLETKTAPA